MTCSSNTICRPEFVRRIALSLLFAALAAPLLAVPEAAQADLEKARAALLRGDGIAAEADLQRAMASGASKPDVAADMGEALIQQNQRGKAREWLTTGQFDPAQAGRGWRLLGMLERLDGDLAASGKAYDRAMALTPNDPQMWVEIGRLRYQGGEHLLALEAANHALEAGPDHPRALEFKAQLVRDAEGDAAALPLFERALSTSPNDLLLLGGYAASLGELSRGNEMLVVARKMIAIDPRHPQAFFLQAVLAARAGNVDLARAMMNRTGDRLAGVPAAMLLNGALELESGNANAASQHLTKLADLQPGNPRVQALLARALYEAGDFQQLYGRFGALAERADASPYLLGILGRALENQGDRAAAAPLLDRAAGAAAPDLMPGFERDGPGALAPRWSANQVSPGLTASYVRSLLGAGDNAAARRVASRFLELRPGSAEALGLDGDVALQLGQAEPALERYAASAKVRFNDQLALRWAIALERAGRGDQAPAFVANYLTLYPASRIMTRVAANQALAAKDWPRARLLLENLRWRGGNRDAGLLADLSLAQLRSGDAEAALLSAERAWQIAPASPFSALTRALALSALGRDPVLARQLVDQLSKTAPRNPLLAEARSKLR
jgi:cellulose synthase operon protein C